MSFLKILEIILGSLQEVSGSGRDLQNFDTSPKSLRKSHAHNFLVLKTQMHHSEPIYTGDGLKPSKYFPQICGKFPQICGK
jgi:hypothetical protein